MPPMAPHSEIHLGPQGRVVIPAPLRRRLGFEEGDKLVARLEDGRLILEKREAIIRRLKERFGCLPAGRSLAGELLAERRKEVEGETSR